MNTSTRGLFLHPRLRRTALRGLVAILVPLLASASAMAGSARPATAPDGAAETFALERSGPYALALDRRGNLYVAEPGEAPGQGRIILRTPGGERVPVAEGLDSPAALIADRDGSLLVALQDSGEIRRIRPDGAQEVLARGLNHPTALALDRDGGLWVACGNGELRKVSPADRE